MIGMKRFREGSALPAPLGRRTAVPEPPVGQRGAHFSLREGVISFSLCLPVYPGSTN